MSESQFPEVTLTAGIYWAAQPPSVRKLRDLPCGGERDTLAYDLARGGSLIDVPIMVWNWDPAITMGLRLQLGFGWVPSAFQTPDKY